MADWQTGLLQGFLGRKSETEKENIRQADLASQREHALFTALLGPEVNPEVQAMALSGLLEQTQARPRKGGLRGWVGEREASPIFQQLKSMIATPVPQEIEVPTEQQTLGSRQFGGPAVQPQLRESPGPEGAAMPAEAPVQGGGGPPVPLSWQAAPPQPYVLREKKTVMGPRKIYLTPQERYEQEATGKRLGELQADRAEMTALNIPQDVQADIIKQKIARRYGGAVGTTYAEGEITPDPQSPTGYSQVLYLRSDPTVQQKIPALAPRAKGTRAPNPQEIEASRLFGKPGEDPRDTLLRIAGGPTAATDLKQVQEAVAAQAGTVAGAQTTGRGQAAAGIPLSTEQRFQATTKIQEAWRKAIEPAREVERQFQLMQTGLQRFRAGDKIGGSQAVLVTFQKILDPQSVVRESEYERTPEGLGLLQRIQGSFERLRQGGAGIPDAELAGIVETAKQFLQGLRGWNATERRRLEADALDFGLDPSRVLEGTTATGSPTAPPRPRVLGPPVTTAPTRNLDTVVPGLYVDDATGQIIQR